VLNQAIQPGPPRGVTHYRDAKDELCVRTVGTLRDGMLVELESAVRPPSLEELERLLQAWIERIYHRRTHSETKMTPLERFGGFTPRYPTRGELREAFLWSESRLVTKTATVSLLSNRYEVDQALCGRRVELRFDPYDLELIEVYYAGQPFGHAVGYQIARHVHPHTQEPADEPRPATGIDYLRLIEADHERDWLARQLDYHELLAAEAEPGSDGDEDGDEDDGGVAVLAPTGRR
jgi:putative transposase